MESAPAKRLVPAEVELVNGVSWLIKLRWLAVVGVPLIPFIGSFALKFHFSLVPFFWIGAAIFFYNILCFLYVRRLTSCREKNLGVYNRFANLQIFFDWILLALLAHFSGGIESPILVFFIFHVILASQLLSKKACYLHATLAVVLIAGIGIFEYSGRMPHYHYADFMPVDMHDRLNYVFVIIVFLSVMLYVSTYLATTVSGRLRQQDDALLKMNDDVEKAHQELVAFDKEKTEFMLIVAHEIRAPLSAIQSMLMVIIEGYLNNNPVKAKDFIVRAEARTRNLLDLVKELLDLAYSKKPVSKADISCVDTAAVAQKLIALYRPKCAEKNIELIFNKPEKKLYLELKLSDLELLFTNLIDNAVKYTPAGGSVAVSAAEDVGHVIISVKDTGIGIPKEDVEKIFEGFYRAENARRLEVAGTGLGLSVVKQILNRYNAKMSVESKINNGTTFKITFPKG